MEATLEGQNARTLRANLVDFVVHDDSSSKEVTVNWDGSQFGPANGGHEVFLSYRLSDDRIRICSVDPRKLRQVEGSYHLIMADCTFRDVSRADANYERFNNVLGGLE